MSEQLGQPVYAVRGWEMLKRWGFKRKVPRPRHAKTDEQAQAAFMVVCLRLCPAQHWTQFLATDAYCLHLSLQSRPGRICHFYRPAHHRPTCSGLCWLAYQSPCDPLTHKLQLLFQPAYSPELQPSEHLWCLSDQPLRNRYFSSLDELEAVQAERCAWLKDHPDIVRSATNFHWWPQAA